jgi:hypothetical protein
MYNDIASNIRTHMERERWRETALEKYAYAKKTA